MVGGPEEVFHSQMFALFMINIAFGASLDFYLLISITSPTFVFYVSKIVSQSVLVLC